MEQQQDENNSLTSTDAVIEGWRPGDESLAVESSDDSSVSTTNTAGTAKATIRNYQKRFTSRGWSSSEGQGTPPPSSSSSSTRPPKMRYGTSSNIISIEIPTEKVEVVMSPSPKEGSPGSMMKGGEGGSGAHTPVNPYIHPLVLTRTHSHPLVDSRDVLLFDGDTDWKTDAVPASIPYASTSPPPSVFYPYGPHPMKPVGLAQLAHDYKYTGQDGDQKEAFPSPPSATYYLPPLPFTATAANTTSSSLSSSVPASSLLPPPGRSSLPVTVQEVNSLKSGWRFGRWPPPSPHPRITLFDNLASSPSTWTAGGSRMFGFSGSTSTTTTPRQTFLCLICYENVLLKDQYKPSLTTGLSCVHRFCKSCLRSYLTSHTQDGIVLNPCPLLGSDGCNYLYTDQDVQALVDEDTYHKYQKFCLIRSNENYRECPNGGCGRLVLGDAKQPRMTCDACQTAFCFFHSDAHPQESCLQYVQRTRKADRASTGTIKKCSKPCPACHAPIEKNGGCNHITCIHCGHQWCWLCKRAYTEDHYAPNNLRGCPGGQFLETGFHCGRCQAVSRWLLWAFLSFVIAPPLALVLLVVLQVLWWISLMPFYWACTRNTAATVIEQRWCFYLFPTIGIFYNDVASWEEFNWLRIELAFVLGLPIQLLWMPVGAVVGSIFLFFCWVINRFDFEHRDTTLKIVLLPVFLTYMGLRLTGVLVDDEE